MLANAGCEIFQKVLRRLFAGIGNHAGDGNSSEPGGRERGGELTDSAKRRIAGVSPEEQELRLPRDTEESSGLRKHHANTGLIMDYKRP